MNKYPSTILSNSNSSVMFISKEDIIKLCSLDSLILNNLMGLLSNKILMLNKKLKIYLMKLFVKKFLVF